MSAPQPQRPGFGYSPALDGLRALAVCAVMFFHFGVPGLTGGFLGVDAFFVLSGFLITSLLLAEQLRTGHIRLSAFWARRARRLLPALFAVLLATVIVGHYLLQNSDLALLRVDSMAALGYVANWRMIWRGTGYFAATATPSPLQHTWSLGIEEQFYLIWPLIVAGLLAWLAARRTRRVLIGFCAAGTVASALAAAYLYNPDDINRDYFGTDTRAQALLIGAGLAAILHESSVRPPPRHRGAVRHLGLGAAALLGAAATAWMWHVADGTDGWLYHGGLTFVALCVALVIAHAVVSPRSPTARLLAVPPLVWIGQISYGLYLWHWPIYSYLNQTNTGLTGAGLFAARMGLTLLVSVTSYYLLESPIRHGALTRRLPHTVPVGVTVAALGVTAVTVVLLTAPAPALPPAAAVITHVTPRPRSTNSSFVVPMDRTNRAPGNQPRIDFFGDSVSWTIGTYLPAHPGMTVHTRAVEGCGIATLPDILELGTPHTNYPGCTTWYDRWQKGVDTDNPDVSVIELNRWELMDRKLNGTYQHVGEPAYNAYLMGQLDRAVSTVGSKGAAVVLLTAAYTHRAEKPDGSLYPEDQPARVDAWNALLRQEAAKHPDTVTVLDLNKLVCPAGTFTWDIGKLQIRSDGLHYTPAGVQRIIAPWLLPQLAGIASGTAPPAGLTTR